MATAIPTTAKGKLDFFGKDYGTIGSSQSGFSIKSSMNKASRNEAQTQAKAISAGAAKQKLGSQGLSSKEAGISKKK